jgi:hypothetical protein|tara:strand:- start:686 stop:934 length:249 start_codon:yes stop_codon:yes gene_type:complete
MDKNHSHPCCSEQVLQSPYHHVQDDGKDTTVENYWCHRGHKFQSSSPLVIAVDGNPDYNSGPICSYCLVDWYRNNINAELET